MGYVDDLAVLAGLAPGTESRQSTNVHAATGVAHGDSSDGRVLVDMGGVSITGDGSQYVSVPTMVDVRDGDEVHVELVGADGTAKSMVVTGVVGGGDRTRTDVDNAVSDASQAVSDASQAVDTAGKAADTANTAKHNADAAMAETKDLVTLRIDSSRGTVFKNSEVSTVLTVRCYKRGQELTTLTALRQAMLDATARIRWYVLREGDTDWVSLADSDPMLSNDGFTLTVTPDDVSVKCTFKAEIVTG